MDTRTVLLTVSSILLTEDLSLGFGGWCMAGADSEHLEKIERSISCEDDLQEYLAAGMGSSGWNVSREVTPDRSKSRADLIAHHSEIGWMGIECKYIDGGGVKIGEAIQQVRQNYKDEQYAGISVPFWGVAVYGRHFSSGYLDRDNFESDEWYDSMRGAVRGRRTTAQSITNSFGLGWVTAYADRVLMEFGTAPTGVKIPLFSQNETMPERYYEELDVAKINSLSDK